MTTNPEPIEPQVSTTTVDALKADGERIEEPRYIISWPTESPVFLQVLHAIGLPLKIFLFFTIPDCRLRRFKRLFWLTFIMSCIWISIYSYVMVWMITIIGETFTAVALANSFNKYMCNCACTELVVLIRRNKRTKLEIKVMILTQYQVLM